MESSSVKLDRHRGCWGCSDEAEERLSPTFEWDETRHVVTGEAVFGRLTQGPPGHAHGGSLFTVLDEAMGAAAWLSGHPVLAASITIQYRSMVPLGSRLSFEARVVSVDGRKVQTSAELRDGAELKAEATGLFLVIPPEKLGAIPGTMESIDRYRLWQARRGGS